MELNSLYNDFCSKITVLGEVIRNTRQVIMSEEHTKMAYIVPFLTNLGFDMTNPMEVVPEYTCDFGTKRGEKVDYALFVNNEPYIIVEAKDCRNDISTKNVSQLFRYFSVSTAKLAILSNGIEYWFFTDSVEKNKMDKEPFFKFNFLKFEESDLKMLFRFHKQNCTKEDALSFLRVKKVEDDLYSWFVLQSINPSLKFINFLKRTAGINAQDIDFTSALKNVLGVFKTIDEYNQLKENDKITLVEETADEQFGKVEDTKKKTTRAQKKNMTGITACLSIKEIMETDITGSKAVGVIFEDTGNCYICTSFTDIFTHLITEMLECGFTVDEIVSCDDGTELDVLKTTKDGIRVAGECNGIYYEKNLSTKDVMKKVAHLLTCLCLDMSTTKIVMCNRADYRVYSDAGFSDEEIIKKLYGTDKLNIIINDIKVDKDDIDTYNENNQLCKSNNKCNGKKSIPVEDTAKAFRQLFDM